MWMNERGLLLEMPVVSENEVFAQSPVASVSTESTLNLEGDKLRTFVMGIISKTPLPQNYELTDRELGTIISHHCTGKPLRKAALQTIPQVLISNNIISPWKRKEGKGVLSGLVAAPISINGEKYLCCVTLHKNLQKIVTPYAITLKDADGNIVNEEKAISAIKVPDSTDGNSTFGNTRLSTGTASLDTNSPLGANIPNKVNESKTNKDMKKNIVKISENTLRQIVAESVKKVLNEEFSQGTLEYEFEERIIKRFSQAIEEAALNMAKDIAGDERDMMDMAKQAIQNVWQNSLKRGCYERIDFSDDLWGLKNS
jgi:hypothetical protein